MSYRSFNGPAPHGAIVSGFVLFTHASDFDASAFAPRAFVGSHIVRDPRDLAVSGYHYHLWSAEHWLRIPRETLDGATYQEYLRRLDFTSGLLAEVRRVATEEVPELLSWNYDSPDFLELRYEDLIRDEDRWFRRLFDHWGLPAEGRGRWLDTTRRLSFEPQTRRPLGKACDGEHLRCGRPGQWRDSFDPIHRAVFKELAGEALISLGYERDLDW